VNDLIVGFALAFGLVVTRLGGFIVVSPFPGPTTPTQTRIGLVLALALVLVPGPLPASFLGPKIVLAAVSELAAGAMMGLIFRIGMSAADVLGSALGQSMGLTMASIYDPVAASNVDPVSRLVTAAAMLLALAGGAHRTALGAVLESFHFLPLGASPDVVGIGNASLVWVEQSLECGLRLAVPAIAIAVVAQVGLGLVGRAAPALQAFGVAVPLTLVSGLFVLFDIATDIFAGLAVHLERLGPAFAVAFSGH
jgi:flagellar biosynthetic protein FliR